MTNVITSTNTSNNFSLWALPCLCIGVVGVSYIYWLRGTAQSQARRAFDYQKENIQLENQNIQLEKEINRLNIEIINSKAKSAISEARNNSQLQCLIEENNLLKDRIKNQEQTISSLRQQNNQDREALIKLKDQEAEIINKIYEKTINSLTNKINKVEIAIPTDVPINSNRNIPIFSPLYFANLSNQNNTRATNKQELENLVKTTLQNALKET